MVEAVANVLPFGIPHYEVGGILRRIALASIDGLVTSDFSQLASVVLLLQMPFANDPPSIFPAAGLPQTR